MRFRAQSKLHAEQDAEHDAHAPQDWNVYLKDLVAQPTAVLCRMLDSLEVRAHADTVCNASPLYYLAVSFLAACNVNCGLLISNLRATRSEHELAHLN
jgi:hypothetical protein